MPPMHIVVWKSQIGTKTLVNLGAEKNINLFLPVTEGLQGFFLIYFLTTIGPAHYTYNIQLTKNNFNEIFVFQNSPVQPLS